MKNTSRVTRSKEEARHYYNRLSRWYDLLAGSSEEKFRQTGAALLDARPGERVLEIGFGTGGCLVDFARAVGAGGWVGGIELSDGMADTARRRLASAGIPHLPHRVNLLLADGAYPPFPPSSFDAIFMSFTLELFDTPDIPRVLQRCREMLRPGGRLAVVSLVKTDPPGLAERVYEWAHDRWPVAVDCRPIEAQSALRQAGFTIENIIRETMWGLPVESILGRDTIS